MRLFIVHIIFFLTVVVNAQDVHLSQFYTSPSLTNPAMTGAFSGSYRIGLNVKDQWGAIASAPYQTLGTTVDFAIPLKYDMIGIGIGALQDVSGPASLSRTKLMAQLGYHYALGYDQESDLSIGVQYALTQRSVKSGGFTLPSQYDGDFGFNSALDAGEDILLLPTITYSDIAAGAHWFYTPEDMPAYYAGFSAYHINRPVVSFFDGDEKLSIRYNVHGAMRVFLDEKYSVMTKFNVSKMGRQLQMIIGAEAEYYYVNTSREKVSMFGAAFYRFGDALAIIAGLDISRVRLGLSYDINISGLSAATGGRGGFELSLVYKGIISRFQGFKCPKFDTSF